MSERPLVPAFICFVGGILAGRFIPYYNYLLLIFLLIIVLLLFFLFLTAGRVKLLLIPLIFLVAGLFLEKSRDINTDLVQMANGKKIILEGTVISPSKKNDQSERFEIKAEKLFLDNKITSVHEKVAVTVYNNPGSFTIGTRIRFPASLKPFGNFKNPGAYDYELSMLIKGLSCNASVSDGRYIVPMGRGDPGFLIEILEKIRQPFRDMLNSTLSEKNNALFRSLLLGETEGIDDNLRESFNLTGLGHVLAVSGLNVGMIAWIFFFLCRHFLSLSEWLLIRYDLKRITAFIACFPVIGYTALCGFQMPVQRAMIMSLTYFFSVLIERESDIWSTLVLSAFIILAIDPFAIESISFQLTFLAMVGLIWLTPSIQKIFPDISPYFKNYRMLKTSYFYITGIISASLAANIFLLPVTIFYFNRVPVVSLLANLLVIPLVGFFILPSGMFTLLTLHISTFAAKVILMIDAFGLNIMMRIIEYLAALPWACFWMVTPSIVEILLFYSLLFCIVNLRQGKFLKYCTIAFMLLFILDISYWVYETHFNRNMRIYFLDVGQGNSALIQFPDQKRMLIDGGGFLNSTFDTGKGVIAPFLFRNKLLHIDYLVLTHSHPDHLKGLTFIASEFAPDEFWYNGEDAENEDFKGLMEVIKSEKIKIFTPDALSHDRDISGVKIEIFYPFLDENNSGNRYLSSHVINDQSLVLKLTFMGRSVLFPGDIEIKAEDILVKRYGDKIKSDILLVPHHGSKYSSSKVFLETVRPEICITSSRQGNSFGFPHAEVLNRIKSTGSKIFRIDQGGAVEVKIGEGLFFAGYCVD